MLRQLICQQNCYDMNWKIAVMMRRAPILFDSSLHRAEARVVYSRVTKNFMVNSVDFRKQHEPALEEQHDDGV